MEEQRLRNANDRMTQNQRALLQLVLAEEEFLESSSLETTKRINAMERNITALKNRKKHLMKKIDGLRSSNGRLRMDLETAMQDIHGLHQELSMGAVQIKREIDSTQSDLRGLRSSSIEMDGNLETVTQKIAITQNVMSELETEHKQSVDLLLGSTLKAFESFQRWVHIWPAVKLALAADGDALHTIHNTAKVAGKMEECASLRFMTEEIQRFSNIDFRSLDDQADKAHHSHHHFWDDLLARLRKYADGAVARASQSITEVEELEKIRQRLRNVARDLETAISADIRITLADVEITGVSVGKEQESSEPTVIVPVIDSIPTTATMSDDPVRNEKRRQALMDRAVIMAQAEARHKQQEQDSMRKLLSEWSSQTSSFPVGDLASTWCTRAFSEMDPMSVWALAKEFPSVGSAGRYGSLRGPSTANHDALSLAGYGDDAINSSDLCRTATEYRRILRELQLSLAVIPSSTRQNHKENAKQSGSSPSRQLSSIETSSVDGPSLELEPRFPTIFKDWIHFDNILQYTGQKYDCSPVEVVQSIYSTLDEMEPIEELNYQRYREGDYGDVAYDETVHSNRDDNPHVEDATQVTNDVDNEAGEQDSFDVLALPSQKVARTKTARFAAQVEDKVMSSTKSKATTGSRGRYTISQRMNENFSAVLKLFPTEQGDIIPADATLADVAGARENVLLLAAEKAELEKEDLSERVILHLTCRVSGDLLNIGISWQPHLERLKIVAHCLQLSGKEMYQLIITKEDVDGIFADSNDTVLRNMKLDNATVCKALVSCARIEHFPPSIAYNLLRKSRSIQSRPQLKSVPIVEASLFVDTMKLLTFRSASGALITCCLESNMRSKPAKQAVSKSDHS